MVVGCLWQFFCPFQLLCGGKQNYSRAIQKHSLCAEGPSTPGELCALGLSEAGKWAASSMLWHREEVR